ncbi:aldolase [Tunturiibacter empetritectus]|uniref:Aldolase n=2 Tax=Tunturiibacter TaxID=3154218 RepID=A0A852VDK6_9BACT|nr:aldolase [Edaphobacter lichenicola]NYF88355.1 hypothetical protein [Edaphobacter lichenicola]
MTIQEIERACDNSQLPDFSRPELPKPELTLTRRFYPYGFPVEVRTNSADVLEVLEGIWGKFEQRYNTTPISSEVHLVTSDSLDCPPLPVYRLMSPLFISIADKDNYSIVDMERNTTQICLSDAALHHKLYAGYYFLGTPVSCIASCHTTPVHAGCVALKGRGVLLCGDSGAGKSTLSYACARKGWTYVSDDGSYLLSGGKDRVVTGNCHQVRFRPTAAELFPEIGELKMMPRAAGKPSVEMQTSMIPGLTCAQATKVDFIVFLNRRSEGRQGLVPYRKDVTRNFMRQMLFGPPDTRDRQHAAIEQLLTAEVFELRYKDLNWAVHRLEKLVHDRQ